MTKLTTPDEVLEYWFADSVNGTVDLINARMALWFFRSSAEFEAIQTANAGLIDFIVAGSIGWDIEENPMATLAAVIVLDQFSRSVYRGTAKAFAADELCAKIVKRALDKGWYLTHYSPIERMFLVLSLQHSEEMANQELGMQLVNLVGSGGNEEIINYFANIKGFQSEHYDVVKRFGRFPHRNELLSRDSTPEEVEWLSGPECPPWAKSQQKAK